MSDKKFMTSIGGQALIEGIMMKGPKKTSLAVRKPNKEIHIEVFDTKHNRFKNVPIVRGAVAMIQSLMEGYKYLMRAADLSLEDAEEDKTKFEIWFEKTFGQKGYEALMMLAAVLGGALSIALFIVLPTFITGLLANFLPIENFMAVIEGALKIVIFIGYLYAVTRIKDIRRVFEYHGAEHKTIACYEHGEELTVENVRKHSRFHPRCGTSFIFIVVLISIILFSFVPWGNTFVRAGIKIVMLPLVMGFAYEIIKYAGRHDNLASKILSAPGKGVQRLTAFEPDDGQIEIAIAAMNEVIPEDVKDGMI